MNQIRAGIYFDAKKLRYFLISFDISNILSSFNCKFCSMKRLNLLLTITLALLSSATFAQKKQGRPTAQLVNENTGANVMLGRINTTNTTRELILLDPRLIAQQVDCSVAGYSFSMSAGGKNFGPVTVTGPKLTSEIKEAIVDWDIPGVTVSIRDIQVKCNGQVSSSAPILLKYDH